MPIPTPNPDTPTIPAPAAFYDERESCSRCGGAHDLGDCALYADETMPDPDELDDDDDDDQAALNRAARDARVLDDLGDLFALADFDGVDVLEIAGRLVAQARSLEMRICRHCGRAIQRDYDEAFSWVDAPGLVFCNDQDETHDGQRHEPRDAAAPELP